MDGAIHLENNRKGLLTIAVEDSVGHWADVHLTKEDVKILIDRLENAEVE